MPFSALFIYLIKYITLFNEFGNNTFFKLKDKIDIESSYFLFFNVYQIIYNSVYLVINWQKLKFLLEKLLSIMLSKTNK